MQLRTIAFFLVAALSAGCLGGEPEPSAAGPGLADDQIMDECSTCEQDAKVTVPDVKLTASGTETTEHPAKVTVPDVKLTASDTEATKHPAKVTVPDLKLTVSGLQSGSPS